MGPLAWGVANGIGTSVAGSLIYNLITDNDDIVEALAKIQQSLLLIDQAIVDGFGGLDPDMERLRDQRDGLLEEQARVFDEMGSIIQERGIDNSDILEQLHLPDKLRTYEEAMPLWEHSDRLVAVLEQLAQIERGMEDRRSDVSPLSGVASIGSAVGNNCCSPHEQVMGAVNKAMPVAPGLGLSSGSDSKLAGLEDSVHKGKVATDNLISPEAKASLDDFSAKFSGIFEQASRDGKITAGEIGNSFKQMAMDILHDQVFSKLFAGIGPCFSRLFDCEVKAWSLQH